VKANRLSATYSRLRQLPIWKLLAADTGPFIIALLQTNLYQEDRSVPASILLERMTRDLQELNLGSDHLPQNARAYISDWLRDGYLERHFPPGALEEDYQLSSAAVAVIRFVNGLAEPRLATTESRLAVVIQQVVGLAEQTDANPETRIASLLAERERLDREIEQIQQGHVDVLSDRRALERIREIITLADGLAADFRRVREDFDVLNRELRERIFDEAGSRGEILENLFAGVDVIAESDSGRTFSAFWRLLTDPEQSALLDEAVDRVIGREFATQLQPKERRFLLGLTRSLLTQGGLVHEVSRHFAASLKTFVHSREYLEQRRLNQLLRDAQRAAVTLRDTVRPSDAVGYTLDLTSIRMSSVSQWSLYDPSTQGPPGAMESAEAPLIDLDTVAELVAYSEINFRELTANIRSVLVHRAQASTAEILDRFAATQGLGTVVGYLALGTRHGVIAEGNEMVQWEADGGFRRAARIPLVYFVRERIDAMG